MQDLRNHFTAHEETSINDSYVKVFDNFIRY